MSPSGPLEVCGAEISGASAHPQRCFFRQTLRFAFLPVGGGGTRMARRIV